MSWEEIMKMMDEAIESLDGLGPVPLILPGELEHLDRIVGRYPAWQCQKGYLHNPDWVTEAFETQMRVDEQWGAAMSEQLAALRVFD